MKRMGGNSNWCGPVWMPVNYLLVGSLRKLHRMVAPGVTVPYPTGTAERRTLAEVADDLERASSSASSSATPTPDAAPSTATSSGTSECLSRINSLTVGSG